MAVKPLFSNFALEGDSLKELRVFNPLSASVALT